MDISSNVSADLVVSKELLVEYLFSFECRHVSPELGIFFLTCIFSSLGLLNFLDFLQVGGPVVVMAPLAVVFKSLKSGLSIIRASCLVI